MMTAKTIGVISAPGGLTRELKTGLGHAHVSYWLAGDTLYILNASLGDMRIFCRHAGLQTFLFGECAGPAGRVLK